jgi:hypothetical protein
MRRSTKRVIMAVPLLGTLAALMLTAFYVKHTSSEVAFRRRHVVRYLARLACDNRMDRRAMAAAAGNQSLSELILEDEFRFLSDNERSVVLWGSTADKIDLHSVLEFQEKSGFNTGLIKVSGVDVLYAVVYCDSGMRSSPPSWHIESWRDNSK